MINLISGVSVYTWLLQITVVPVTERSPSGIKIDSLLVELSREWKLFVDSKCQVRFEISLSCHCQVAVSRKQRSSICYFLDVHEFWVSFCSVDSRLRIGKQIFRIWWYFLVPNVFVNSRFRSLERKLRSWRNGNKCSCSYDAKFLHEFGFVMIKVNVRMRTRKHATLGSRKNEPETNRTKRRRPRHQPDIRNGRTARGACSLGCCTSLLPSTPSGSRWRWLRRPPSRTSRSRRTLEAQRREDRMQELQPNNGCQALSGTLLP